MLSSRFAGIPISSSTIDGRGLPQFADSRGASSERRAPYRLRWPTSNRNGGRLQIGIGGRIASEFACCIASPDRLHLWQLVGPVQNRRPRTIDPHQEIPTLGHVHAVWLVSADVLCAVIDGESAIGIELHVPVVDDAVVAFHKSIFSVDGDGPESLVLRNPVGRRVAFRRVGLCSVIDIDRVTLWKESPGSGDSEMSGLFIHR